jgi:hypothetical protein
MIISLTVGPNVATPWPYYQVTGAQGQPVMTLNLPETLLPNQTYYGELAAQKPSFWRRLREAFRHVFTPKDSLNRLTITGTVTPGYGQSVRIGQDNAGSADVVDLSPGTYTLHKEPEEKKP